MNDLSLFNSNQKATVSTNLKVMTVDEVASVLGYDSEYLRKKCTELGFTRNGVKTVLNEEQVTKLKSVLVPRSSDMKVRGQNTVTHLEMLQNIQRDMQWLISYNAELQAENERQKQQLTEQTPKVEMYNELVDRSFCKCLRDTAKFIGEREKHFLQVLQDKKVIYKHAGHYRAYAEYADCFELKAYTYGKNKTGQQLLVNVKGLELVKKIFKEV